MNIIQTIQALAMVCQVHMATTNIADVNFIQASQKFCVAELLECMSQPVTFNGGIVAECLRK